MGVPCFPWWGGCRNQKDWTHCRHLSDLNTEGVHLQPPASLSVCVTRGEATAELPNCGFTASFSQLVDGFLSVLYVSFFCFSTECNVKMFWRSGSRPITCLNKHNCWSLHLQQEWLLTWLKFKYSHVIPFFSSVSSKLCHVVIMKERFERK